MKGYDNKVTIDVYFISHTKIHAGNRQSTDPYDASILGWCEGSLTKKLNIHVCQKYEPFNHILNDLQIW